MYSKCAHADEPTTATNAARISSERLCIWDTARRQIGWFIATPAIVALLSAGVLAEAATDAPASAPSRQSATTSAHNVRELTVGRAIVRWLRGGESHQYGVRLEPGQFLHLVAEQRGIDIVLELAQEDGAEATAIDRWSYTRGTESLSFIAATAGVHKITVRARSRNDARGQYELRIGVRRPVQASDAVVVKAERAYVRGDRLSAEGSPASRAAGTSELETALALWREAPDRLFEATTLVYIGVNSYNDGHLRKALEYCSRSLPLWTELKDQGGKAFALDTIGLVHDALGDPEEALRHFREARSLARAARERQYEAQVLHSIGMAYRSLGDLRRALGHFTDAAALSGLLGDRRWQAHSLHHVGEANVLLGRYNSALTSLTRALRVSRQLGDRLGEATSLHHLGTVFAKTGNLDAALDRFTSALGLRQSAGYRLGEAQTLISIGWTYSLIGDLERARAHYNQGRELAEKLEARPDQAEALYGRAVVERSGGNLVAALNAIETAIGLVESIRKTIRSHEFRSIYFTTVRQYYDLYIDVLMKLHVTEPNAGHDLRALEVSERSKGRVLAEMLADARVRLNQEVETSLLDRERLVRQSIDEHIGQLNSANEMPTTEEVRLRRALGELLSQDEEIQREIRATTPRYASIARPTPLTVAEIRDRVLDADTALVEYSLGPERSYAWILSQNSHASVVLPKRSSVELLSRRVHEALKLQSPRLGHESADESRLRIGNALRAYPQAVGDLEKAVLQPLAAHLTHKRLLIVRDGALQYVPFGLLRIVKQKTQTTGNESDSGLLIDAHEITAAPSASTLDVLRRETRGRAVPPKAVAVFADPVFAASDRRVTIAAVAARPEKAGLGMGPQSGAANATSPLKIGFSRLPFTREEARTIVGLMEPNSGMAVVDFAANRERLGAAEIRQYQTIHFATHGRIDTEHPEQSAIVLSLVDERGRSKNGYITLRDVYALRLPVELVVLSACETALGKDVKGEGLIGLTRGFMYAGSKRVVASLWKVDDVATATLMGEFYRAMTKNRQAPAAALRTAQLALRKQRRWSSPYYWSAFEIQGEWR